ncbi:MAG: ORF6N domain-containing protein [Xanthomonadaceae bacterium]|nr:ORF6N domain-containing protein [Xanthomonadaceae bacterium]
MITKNDLELNVSQKIYFIRGEKVMLDSDLAELYGVLTHRLNQQVRRNLDRFPDDFMFQLTESEWDSLRSQIVILKNGSRGKHKKYLPFVFTEQGVAMLSGVLHSPRAIQVNLAIMRTFVQLRGLLQTNKELSEKLKRLERKYDGQFKIVFDSIQALVKERVTPRMKIRGLSKKPTQVIHAKCYEIAFFTPTIQYSILKLLFQ